jgi:hypothetical protein
MKLSRNIPIIVLVLITLLIGFVIIRKLKNKKQLETQQLKIEEPEAESDTETEAEPDPEAESDTETEGFTGAEGFDATSIITESMAEKILFKNINNQRHTGDVSGVFMVSGKNPKSWEDVKKLRIRQFKEIYDELDEVIKEANKAEGYLKIKGNWEELTRYKTVNDLLGKFIIVKSRKEPSKYKIVYKKNQGWINSSKTLYPTYDAALKAAMDKNGEVIKGIGKLAADQEVRHLTEEELDIVDGFRVACNISASDFFKLKDPEEYYKTCVKVPFNANELNNQQ